jgi:signal peptidase I
MRPRLKASSLGRAAASLLCGLAVCSAVAYAGALGLGYRFFVVMSGSMEPVLPVGGLVMSKPQPASAIRVGDIVTFLAPDGTGRTITHRLHAVVHHRGKTGYRTKGDANPSVDPWTVQFPRQVGVEKLAIPGVGYALYALSTHGARLLLVALLAVLLAFALLGRLWRDELRSVGARLRPRRIGSVEG